MSQITHMRSAGLLLFVLLAFQPGLDAAEDRLLAWRIAGSGAQMTLLGSMHLAREDLYPLREDLLERFSAADTLVVEVDIAGPQEMEIQQMLLTRGSYPPGQTLRDDLSPETLALLEQQATALGLPLFALEQMRPGLVGTMLSVQAMMGLGLNPSQGVDKYFLDLSRGKKNIEALETAEQQVELILDIPNPDLYMRQTLLQLQRIEALVEPMVDSWKRGDAVSLERLLLEDELIAHPEFQPLVERMFYDRNRTMAASLEVMLRAGGHYFVVVGAGHLVGERGIIALLADAGFKTEQL